MRYKRTSFIDYLTNNFTCVLQPMSNETGLRISYNGRKHYMLMTTYITYEEIITICLKLTISLPNHAQLDGG